MASIVVQEGKLTHVVLTSHIRVPGQVPAAPNLIKLPAGAPGKAAGSIPITWASATTWETCMEFLTLGVSLAQVQPFGG